MSRSSLLRLSPALGLLLVWLLVLRPDFLGGSTAYILVAGASMEPTLYTDDLAVLRKQRSYDTGDIVAFNTEGGRVIHRIIGGNAVDGYVLQGDNKDEIDPWYPKPEHIVGKYWFHIPSVGSWVTTFRDPLPFALLMGGLGSVAFIGSKKRRRRRNGRWKDMEKEHTAPGIPPAPAWILGTLFASVAVAMLAGATGVLAWRADTEQVSSLEALRYEHSANYAYSAEVEPSALYPDGVVRPPAAPAESADGAAAVAPPLYWSLDPRLQLQLDYTLLSEHAPTDQTLAGEVRAEMILRAGPDGWTRTFDLMPPTPFEGTSTAIEIPVELAEVRALTTQVEEETGYAPSNYELTIVSTVDIAGAIGGEPISETFEAPLTMSLTRTQIAFGEGLTHAESRAVTETMSNPQHMALLGLSMPVTSVRQMTVFAFILSAGAAACIGAVVFLGIGRSERAQIRARYGSMLVTVADTQGAVDTNQVIRLARIDDLVRLARRDGRMILHRQTPEIDEYFVQDGGLTYLYQLKSSVPDAVTKPREA